MREPSLLEGLIQLMAVIITGCGIVLMIAGKHDHAQSLLLVAIVFVLATSY